MSLQRTSARLATSVGTDARSVLIWENDAMLRRRTAANVGDKGIPEVFESRNCNGFPRYYLESVSGQYVSDSGQTFTDQVDYVSGRTRLFGIVGHPIEQVRSPEMFTAEFRRRALDAILVPMHVLPEDFDALLPQLLRLSNLDGLIFTIPYKLRARALAGDLGDQARIVGAINALGRRAGGWRGDIFDGIGCVEAFRRRGIALTGRRALLLGAGGAGSAIGVALAAERPASLRLYDVDATRAEALAATITRAFPGLAVSAGPPRLDEVDILLNATPAGMLDDARLPIAITSLPRAMTVFDAIVKPETTPLLALAERCGCTTVRGREMMRGQIARIVDYFLAAD
jgi:shikimate dehydrogenase